MVEIEIGVLRSCVLDRAISRFENSLDFLRSPGLGVAKQIRRPHQLRSMFTRQKVSATPAAQDAALPVSYPPNSIVSPLSEFRRAPFRFGP